MKKVAIIGMGVAGLAVLKALEKLSQNQDLDIQIDAYDRPESFGRGFPFRPDAETALLNSPRETISIDHEEITDFDKWIKEQGIPLRDYYPRSVYGDYQKSRLDQVSIDYQSITEPVINIQAYEDGWQVVTETQMMTYDQVHLACGELPTVDHYDLMNSPSYVHQPYPLEKELSFSQSPKTIGIIGMGLSAVDVIKHLATTYPKAQLLAFSPSQQFPSCRGLDRSLAFQYLTLQELENRVNSKTGRLSFEDFDQVFKQELTYHQIDWESLTQGDQLKGVQGLRNTYEQRVTYTPVQQIAMEVTVMFTEFWHRMTEDDKETYLHQYGKIIKNLRNPMPPESAGQLLDLVDSGRLMIIDQPDHIQWEFGAYRLGQYTVETLVNATGQKLTPNNLDQAHPFLQELLAQNLVSWDKLGGFRMDPQSGQSLNDQNQIQPDLYLHGQLINGCVYQNNSTIKIQQQAEKAIHSIDWN